MRTAVTSKPTKIGFVRDIIGSLEQARSIYVNILAAVEVAQQTDTAE